MRAVRIADELPMKQLKFNENMGYTASVVEIHAARQILFNYIDKGTEYRFDGFIAARRRVPEFGAFTWQKYLVDSETAVR